MKRLLILIIAAAVVASLSACATLSQNVKSDEAGVRNSDQPQYQAASVQYPDWWVYDTPYGY
ncbi:MAG: hypothetical protein Kow0099_26430 [Candidatus Abyssubacteria bacterium]